MITSLKSQSQITGEGMIKEIRGLNLNRYTSEVAESISKTNFQSYKNSTGTQGSSNSSTDASEISILVEICEIMHQRYEDFQKQLVTALSKQFKACEEIPDEEAKTNQRRALLFLMTELFIIGIIVEYKRIFQCLQKIFTECNTCTPSQSTLNIMLISSYLKKYQVKILNMKSRKEKHFARGSDKSSSEDSALMYKFLPQEQSEALVKVLIKFYTEVALKNF